jgi:hypothetical protein
MRDMPMRAMGKQSGLGHTGSQHSAVPRCWPRRPTPTLIPILNLPGNAKSQ